MNKTITRILSCFILDKQKRHKFILDHLTLTDTYGDKKLIYNENAQEIIKNKLNSDEPCLICRFGITEFRVLYSYIFKKSKYSKSLYNMMCSVYPISRENLDKYAQGLFDLTQNIDILACWSNPDEAKYCKKYCTQKTVYVNWGALTSITYSNPWTSALKGKKVLVIHPFEETIKKQYAKRELLFKNPETLPEFELITLKPPYITKENIQNQPYSSWFEALDDIKKQIETYDFDIAIIGAGPFGIFLADYCKKLGKKAVHAGGVTQLLFGITGKRWDVEQSYVIENVINEHWVRPSEEEKPEGFKKIEGGCYW